MASAKPYNGSLRRLEIAFEIYNMNDPEQRALRRILGRDGWLLHDEDGEEAAPLSCLHLAIAQVLENRGLWK